MVTEQQSADPPPEPQVNLRSCELPFPAIVDFLLVRGQADSFVERLWAIWSVAELVASYWESSDDWVIRGAAQQVRAWEREFRAELLARTGDETDASAAVPDAVA